MEVNTICDALWMLRHHLSIGGRTFEHQGSLGVQVSAQMLKVSLHNDFVYNSLSASLGCFLSSAEQTMTIRHA